jgi:hypothetical protein
MWKNIVERGRSQMKVWRTRIVCRIPKATNTLSEYVILIAFPQQKWLQERASMLRYTYICLPCSAVQWEDTFTQTAWRSHSLVLFLKEEKWRSIFLHTNSWCKERIFPTDKHICRADLPVRVTSCWISIETGRQRRASQCIWNTASHGDEGQLGRWRCSFSSLPNKYITFSLEWHFPTDVSIQPSGPIFRAQEIPWHLKMEKISCPEKSVGSNNYLPTVRDNLSLPSSRVKIFLHPGRWERKVVPERW